MLTRSLFCSHEPWERGDDGEASKAEHSEDGAGGGGGGGGSQATTKPNSSDGPSAKLKALLPSSKSLTHAGQATLASGADGLMTVQTRSDLICKSRDAGKRIVEAPAKDPEEERKKVKATALTETVAFSPHSSLREDCARRMLHGLSGKLLVPQEYIDVEDRQQGTGLAPPHVSFWLLELVYLILE
ncbi:unnamed protein product [Linum trigynum]|uniref:Uncharacterized protein n=1 Tax=Linum trigynum TaxID=586398 RepID=A0AAV2GIJ3_9ROSI